MVCARQGRAGRRGFPPQGVAQGAVERPLRARAAAAAAQAAAAAAAAPAPLIRTLPNNKTVYTSQGITAVPVIQSAGTVQSLRHEKNILCSYYQRYFTSISKPLPLNLKKHF